MGSRKASTLVFSSLPPIYILPTHIPADKLHAAEETLLEHGGSLTYNPKEAQIFLAQISQKKRASFDLRSRGVWTEEVTQEPEEPTKKRLKLSASQTASSLDDAGAEDHHFGASWMNTNLHGSSSPAPSRSATGNSPNAPHRIDRVTVLKLDWLYNSTKQHEILPFEPYIIYSAKVVQKPLEQQSPTALTDTVTNVKAIPESSPSQHPPGSLNSRRSPLPSVPNSDVIATTLTSAKTEAVNLRHQIQPNQLLRRRRFNQSTPTLTHPSKPPKLQRTTTSEFEQDPQSLPEPPAWVRENNIYSCARSTPLHSPNAAFLEQLHEIKEARLLTSDEIGVRAYSTSIAAIAAYPYVIQSEAEVLRLPGCDQKIAALWSEWHASAEDDSERSLEVVQSIQKDEDLKHIRLFYGIWGVGADTARRFYFDQGWKDIDDIVEFGWSTLNRVQQIGVKFYDEFQVKIPRAEVEEIAAVVLKHARYCRGIPEQDWGTDRDIVSIIVGGYRRGKELNGDVDVILSHRDENYTKALVIDVVASLEEAGWITHTLTLNTTTSDRNQQTLPYRGQSHGHGFDSLDKALCVCQDPNFDERAHEKNPNIHRRVDIIVSSWRTVGCAVLGWSGATTFQRDIRRWVKRKKGWKFDSSGVRDRSNGLVLDLEKPRNKGDGDTWLDREKRLMAGLGIGWRPATKRCTG